jgi:hypothetical protein
MALPASTEIQNMHRSLTEGRLTEQQSRDVLAWLYEALVELERRRQN